MNTDQSRRVCNPTRGSVSFVRNGFDRDPV